jgi:hypothetical protein
MRIIKTLGSETRPCNCVIGVYETYDGEIVKLVDAVNGLRCGHQLGQRLLPGDESSDHMPSGPAWARRSS